MITVNNYFEEVDRIGVNNLPDTLKKGHDLVVKSTANGSSWTNYTNSENIRKVINLYFQKLNDYASSLSVRPSKTSPLKEYKQHPERKEKETEGDDAQKKSISKKSSTKKNSSKPAKQVEHIREEVKFIKRYVGLHNKVKSPNAILAFIKALQRASFRN